MRESGGRFVQAGPVVAVQREIAACSSLPSGTIKQAWSFPGDVPAV